MEITIVMLSGESHNFLVNPNDTVGALKKLIQDKLGVSSERQRLVYDNGHRTFLNDDSMPVSAYGLQNGSRVSLIVTGSFQVFLRNEKGKSSTYDVTSEETVSDFKAKVQTREGVAVSQQRLVFQGREMASGKLSDYCVKEHSTIDMMMRLRGG
ncbi:polyubiquitin-like [Labrus bergylta]|uniref:ISG15 ubiquitin like modifier n=1 Tax=Labrus bergylta TaxID=56723 RepID=A0A3Q3ETN6_9LABR|nr:polyubiquitin-like [Labrus bergylta]XP_020505409.1 polyubiquitin-like [Labrus bergylta]XP_020505410.1 polyubiquitin-like [Labrus bergylta]